MDYTSRLQTFKKWYLNLVQNPSDLANAGFVWTGVSDAVKCVSCNCIIRNWTTRHRPLQRHLDESENCEFLRRTLGEAFLRCYKKPNRQANGQRFCRICDKKEISEALLPCGHVVTCDKCMKKIGNFCPICFSRISSNVRIYYT